jgi:hypothetical protein
MAAEVVVGRRPGIHYIVRSESERASMLARYMKREKMCVRVCVRVCVLVWECM